MNEEELDGNLRRKDCRYKGARPSNLKLFRAITLICSLLGFWEVLDWDFLKDYVCLPHDLHVMLAVIVILIQTKNAVWKFLMAVIVIVIEQF